MFDGDPATCRKKGTPTPSNSWLISIVAKWWMNEHATWYGSRPRHRPHCIRRGPSCLRKGRSSPPLFAHIYCGHGRQSQLLLSSCLNYRIEAGRLVEAGHFESVNMSNISEMVQDKRLCHCIPIIYGLSNSAISGDLEPRSFTYCKFKKNSNALLQRAPC